MVSKDKKKPCKHQFTGLGVVARSLCVRLGRFQPVYSPRRGARGGASPSDIELKKKTRKSQKAGGPRPPQIVARVPFRRLDESAPALAAGRRVIVVVARDKSQAKHVNTCSDDIGAPTTDDLMVL